MKQVSLSALSACLLLLAGAGAQAQIATYTFDINFSFGDTTPILTAAPDLGQASLRSDFTDLGNSNNASFYIADNGVAPGVFSNLFSGLFLAEDPGFDFRTLNVNITQPVGQTYLTFSLDYVLSAPGLLQVDAYNGNTLVGSVQQAGTLNAPQGLFDGHLLFTTNSPFTMLNIFQIAPGQTHAQFGIDNLSFDNQAVPEPGALALCLGALVPAGWILRLRRRRSRVA